MGGAAQKARLTQAAGRYMLGLEAMEEHEREAEALMSTVVLLEHDKAPCRRWREVSETELVVEPIAYGRSPERIRSGVTPVDLLAARPRRWLNFFAAMSRLCCPHSNSTACA